jgi:hypothetical protein
MLPFGAVLLIDSNDVLARITCDGKSWFDGTARD